MDEPTNLYADMEKLDKLYEQLGWPHTDSLTFRIEGDKIVIRNLFQEQRDKNITITDKHPFE
jgi:hypothetical protein